MKRTLLITGGAGLVGQNLLADLSPAEYDITVLDKHSHNLQILRNLHPLVRVIEADLAEPGEWFREFVGVDTVVQLHAQIGAPNRDPFERNNLLATAHVLNAMREAGVPYLIHASSSVVNSVAKDFYTDTKRRQEEQVLASGIDCVVLRPTLMFGWFDRKHLGWLSRFMKRVPVFPIPGNGRYMRQPLYARDFCRVIVRCIETRPVGEVHDITGQERIDYIDIIRGIRRAVGARCVIVRIPVRLFSALLKTWARFDSNPPFTADQLAALTAGDEFEETDWPGRFGVEATRFDDAVRETFTHPTYSRVALEF